MQNTFRINVDLKKKTYIEEPVVTQNDAIMFLVSVFDNGAPFSLSEVTTATLAHTRLDGVTVVTEGTKVNDNTIRFILGTEETKVPGRVSATVQLYDADERVSTIRFTYTVLKDPTGNGYIPSEREQTLVETVLGEGPLVIQQAKDAAKYATAQGQYAQQVANENKTRWLTAVNTYADIAATYPNPQLGDTVQTIDDSKIYRWDGTQWVWTQQYNANAITDVQNKIGILNKKTDGTWVNVKEFGAKGDGVTDDSKAIQNALDNTAANTIYFPPGVYRVANVTLRSNKILKLDSKAVVKPVTGATKMFVSFPASEYDGLNNVLITGGEFSGDAENSTQPCPIFALSHCNNITFRDVTFKDVVEDHAMDLAGVKNITVDNCKFLGVKIINTARSYVEAIQIDVAFSNGFPHHGDYDGTPNKNVNIINCYFGASDTSGTQPWGTAIGTHSNVNNAIHENINITGNVFEGCTSRTIRMYQGDGINISGNEFKNINAGFVIDLSSQGAIDLNGNAVNSGITTIKNVNINNNIFTLDPSLTGNIVVISVDGVVANGTVFPITSVNITNNVIKGFSRTLNITGIFCRRVENINVINNVIDNVYSGLVFNNHIRKFLISNNNISTVDRGLLITCATGATSDLLEEITINSNNIFDTLRDAIYINGDNKKEISIINNYCVGKIYINGTVSSSNKQIKITNNYVKNCPIRAVEVWETEGLLVKANLLVDVNTNNVAGDGAIWIHNCHFATISENVVNNSAQASPLGKGLFVNAGNNVVSSNNRYLNMSRSEHWVGSTSTWNINHGNHIYLTKANDGKIYRLYVDNNGTLQCSET